MSLEQRLNSETRRIIEAYLANEVPAREAALDAEAERIEAATQKLAADRRDLAAEVREANRRLAIAVAAEAGRPTSPRYRRGNGPFSGLRLQVATVVHDAAPEALKSAVLLERLVERFGDGALSKQGGSMEPERVLLRVEDALWALRAMGLAERIAPRTWRWVEGAVMP